MGRFARVGYCWYLVFYCIKRNPTLCVNHLATGIMAMNLGVPCKLLKEFKDRKITIEANNGDVYRGLLHDVEENLSVSLDEVKATMSDGKIVQMKGVYLKGSRIRLISLPDSAAEYMPQLTRPARGRGGFRGGRGGRGRGGGRPSFGRR